MTIMRIPKTAWKMMNENIELQHKEISDLKAKNKELEEKLNWKDKVISSLEEENDHYCLDLNSVRVKLAKATRLLLSENSELLNALEELVKRDEGVLNAVPGNDPSRALNFDFAPIDNSKYKALITKYRG